MAGRCHLAKYWGVRWGTASDDTLNLVLKCEDTCESFHCPVGNNSSRMEAGRPLHKFNVLNVIKYLENNFICNNNSRIYITILILLQLIYFWNVNVCGASEEINVGAEKLR